MADKYLTGNDFGVAGSYEGATLPIAGDRVIVIPENGNDVVATVDLAVDLGELIVPKGRKNNKFGSAGAFINVSAAKVTILGGSETYINSSNLGAAGNIDNLRVSLASPSNIFQMGSKAGQLGTFGNCTFQRGNINVGQSVEWAAGAVVFAEYVENPNSDLGLVIESMADTLPFLRQIGGVSTVRALVTDAQLIGGSLTKQDKPITTLEIFQNGICHYNRRAVSGDGTIVRIHSGGFLDLTSNGEIKTISSVMVFGKGRLKRNLSLHTITTLDVLDGGIIEEA